MLHISKSTSLFDKKLNTSKNFDIFTFWELQRSS